MDNLENLDWHDLKILLELDRCGGAIHAAQRLGLSHQTVTRRLRKLEQTLDIRLVNKDVHPWTLTVKGQQVRELATTMETAVVDIVAFAHTDPVAYAGRVGISSVSWALDLLVFPAVRRLKSKHPDLEFDFLAEDQPVDVQAGVVDLALRFTNSPPENLIGRRVAPVSLGVLGHEQLIKDLDNGKTGRVPLVRWFQEGRKHVQWPNDENTFGSVTTVRDFASLVAALRQGLGVGAVPKVLSSTCPELQVSQTVKLGAPRSAWILRNEASRGSNKIKAVEAEILKVGREIFGADSG